MSLSSIIKKSTLLISAFLSLRRKRKILIRKDPDGDFEIHTQEGVFISADPFSYFDEATKKLFEFGYTCETGDNAIIVGVEDGLELIHFCKKCHPGVVLAIEPTKSCILRLKKLKLKNRLTNLIIIEGAAGDRFCSSVPFAQQAERSLLNSLSIFSDNLNLGESVVEMTTLETVIRDYKISKIDFLKINVEGAELLVLNGLGRYSREVKNICVSCHDFIAPSRRSFDSVLAWLEKNGYDTSSPPFVIERPWENYYLFSRRRSV